MAKNDIRSQLDAVTIGLHLCLTAPDDEKARQAAELMESLSHGLTKQEIKRAKADAIRMTDDSIIVSGSICRDCGNTLPDHTRTEHLNESHSVHQCPHIKEEGGAE